MKICAAQTKPVKGNIPANIENHKRLIHLAVDNGADLIIFPELSLTGYEPELAKELAMDKDDMRLDDFQMISNMNHVTIGVGAPTKNAKGICITMIIFQPHQTRQTYSKKYLHDDEKPFFVSGGSSIGLLGQKAKVTLAICYELSVPEHAEHAFKSGAEIYVASVAKTVSGVEKASKSLSDIAEKYSMTVLMSNCVGPCDNFESAGKSSAWNSRGVLLRRLSDTCEGILIIDTETEELIEKTI